MNKRGLVLGTVAVAGLHLGGYLACDFKQRRRIAAFAMENPLVWLAGNAASIYVLGSLFSGKPVARRKTAELVIELPPEFAEAMRADWAADVSSFLEITPIGEVYRVLQNC